MNHRALSPSLGAVSDTSHPRELCPGTHCTNTQESYGQNFNIYGIFTTTLTRVTAQVSKRWSPIVVMSSPQGSKQLFRKDTYHNKLLKTLSIDK